MTTFFFFFFFFFFCYADFYFLFSHVKKKGLYEKNIINSYTRILSLEKLRVIIRFIQVKEFSINSYDPSKR